MCTLLIFFFHIKFNEHQLNSSISENTFIIIRGCLRYQNYIALNEMKFLLNNVNLSVIRKKQQKQALNFDISVNFEEIASEHFNCGYL